MGLFTNPMTLIDANAANRTFEFRAQLHENGAIVGEYIEPAASVSSTSKLTVKHSATNSGKKRHLLQRVETFDLSADPVDGRDTVVVNMTISHHPLATEAQVKNQVTLVIDAAQETGFISKIMREQI